MVDFYCHQLVLVIEVDGEIHQKEDVALDDEDRETNIASFGIHIIRFTNAQVLYDIENVLKQIELKMIEIKNEHNQLPELFTEN